MALRWTHYALSELEIIQEYVKQRSRSGAKRVWNEIVATAELASNFPFIGRKLRGQNTRRLITRRYNYVVYYRIQANVGDVTNISVQHGRRRPKYPTN